MAIFRSFSEIVASIRDRLKLSQPNLTTEPGSVSRDLFIDIQADQVERLYKTISMVSEKQSIATAVGGDLDKLGRNYGIVRNSGTPASGIIVLTLNDLTGDEPIPNNSIVTAKNGATFRVIGNYVMSSVEKSKFVANANRLRAALSVAGISDSYAIEIPVQATRPGKSGNLGSLQIVSHNLGSPFKITNLQSFSNGANTETDEGFRARVLAIFSGSNTGTARGYLNAALGTTGVVDALVVEPGNTLMLRDGTETIEVNDGSFRILNSGTGGKVDIYILGKQLTEETESFVYSDLSFSGDATDERNDVILGQQTTDQTLTTQERRLQAFKTGNLPVQPVGSLISVTGSQSGLFAEKFVAADGSVTGSYELIIDTNVETGGSPFGFDKIHFVSNTKQVDSESIVKPQLNSVDALSFSDMESIDSVYQDTIIVSENSDVSSADKSYIKLKHKPVLTATRVQNKTTGEVYVIQSQNKNDETGLNDDGMIKISGKTLPTSADILSVDYTWRHVFDSALDYDGSTAPSQFVDPSVADSIDWGAGNGIFEEEILIGQTEDEIEYQITTDYNVSRVISVYSKTIVESVVSTGSGGFVVIIPPADPVVNNILTIKNSNGVESYNTKAANGTFAARTITLPTDTSAQVGEAVTVHYNKIELFNIDNSDGSFSNNLITLPSEDILAGNEVDDVVEDLFLSEIEAYVKYVAEIRILVPSGLLSALPITGGGTSNQFLDSGLSNITNSYQPVFFGFDDTGSISYLNRFGPTRMMVDITGSVKPGKVKVLGTTLTRLEVELTAGVSIDGLKIQLSSEIASLLGVSSLSSNIGIGRVDYLATIDSDGNVQDEYDIIGYKIKDNTFDIGTAVEDSTLQTTQFVLPATPNNNSISPSSGSKVMVRALIYQSSDFEELYFPGDTRRITDKRFARVDRISVSSGFRNSSGNLVGSTVISIANQPTDGSAYATNYKFKAPKEGERVTVKYNRNKLIENVTLQVESVRPITADVLVKASQEIKADVYGEILINENVVSDAAVILENVTNAVSNLLNTNTLGGTVDYSDIITVAANITGVDSVNISTFNESGKTGKKAFLTALDNQNIVAGAVIFTSVSRQEFRLT